MNYSRIYDSLILRAKNRKLNEYVEKHHIIPECIGGSNANDNLVELTPEEHYLAHQLLVKMYPSNVKLLYAARMMGTTRKSNKLYGWLKRKYSESQRGKPKSAETRRKLSESKKGIKLGPMSEEQKAHLSSVHKGRVFSEETKRKMSESRKGKTHSAETKQRMAEAWILRKAKKNEHREELNVHGTG